MSDTHSAEELRPGREGRRPVEAFESPEVALDALQSMSTTLSKWRQAADAKLTKGTDDAIKVAKDFCKIVGQCVTKIGTVEEFIRARISEMSQQLKAAESTHEASQKELSARREQLTAALAELDAARAEVEILSTRKSDNGEAEQKIQQAKELIDYLQLQVAEERTRRLDADTAFAIEKVEIIAARKMAERQLSHARDELQTAVSLLHKPQTFPIIEEYTQLIEALQHENSALRVQLSNVQADVRKDHSIPQICDERVAMGAHIDALQAQLRRYASAETVAAQTVEPACPSTLKPNRITLKSTRDWGVNASEPESATRPEDSDLRSQVEALSADLRRERLERQLQAERFAAQQEQMLTERTLSEQAQSHEAMQKRIAAKLAQYRFVRSSAEARPSEDRLIVVEDASTLGELADMRKALGHAQLQIAELEQRNAHLMSQLEVSRQDPTDARHDAAHQLHEEIIGLDKEYHKLCSQKVPPNRSDMIALQRRREYLFQSLSSLS